MRSLGVLTLRPATAAAACGVLFALGLPSAAAAPATDGQGYADSWARCATANVAVVFGSTETSRVAICKSSDGQYQYRGVRVRDGAKLAIEAEPSGNNGFVAENDGIAYTVTPDALLVSMGEKVIRDEPWIDYRGSQTPTAPTTSEAPLPPPLPAEQGAG